VEGKLQLGRPTIRTSLEPIPPRKREPEIQSTHPDLCFILPHAQKNPIPGIQTNPISPPVRSQYNLKETTLRKPTAHEARYRFPPPWSDRWPVTRCKDHGSLAPLDGKKARAVACTRSSGPRSPSRTRLTVPFTSGRPTDAPLPSRPSLRTKTRENRSATSFTRSRRAKSTPGTPVIRTRTMFQGERFL
jgi:hypothetical protein